MKTFLKDYGTLIGPSFAFILGVTAIYIKFYTDRQIESWRSGKKLKKLIELIKKSQPPLKYYSKKSSDGLLHADQARNLTNLSIFQKRITVIKSFIETVENNILTDCSVLEIQQFQDLKFIISYIMRDIESSKNSISSSDFNNIQKSYERLLVICNSPGKEFNYIQ